VHSNEGLYPGAHVLERVSQAAREQLDGEVATARKQVPGARGLLRQGSAWQEVLAAIDEARADLVVLGTHGRRGVERFMLGSVAERVVQRSPVPTIVVP
jgi:nucleotide-binding universal stress UspA family protein